MGAIAQLVRQHYINVTVVMDGRHRASNMLLVTTQTSES